MKAICTAILCLFLTQVSFSQIIIKQQNPATNPLQDSLVRTLVGFGVVVNNISSNLSSSAVANGTFKATGAFPINKGLIMTTGSSVAMAGANSAATISTTIPSTDTVDGTSIGRQMLAIVQNANNPTPTFRRPIDVSTIKMDLVPIGDSIKFKYIFASEEYPEFVCSQFNDAFGFFIKGQGIVGDAMFNGTPFEGYRNIAIIPGTELPVAINTLNDGTDDDPDGLCTFTPEGIAAYVDNFETSSPLYNDLKFDGMSVKLTAKAPTVACTPYSLILAVADFVDGSWDSGVFLEAGSVVSGDYCTFLPFAKNSLNDTVTSCQPGKLIFKRCASHVTEKWVIRFKSQGSAVANVDFKRRMPNGDLVLVPDSVVLSPGMIVDSLMLEPIGDFNEGKTILFRYQNLQIPFINGQPNYMEGTTNLYLKPVSNLAGEDLTRCWFDTARFRSQFLALPSTSYNWYELVDGQLTTSQNLSCNQCPNPVIMMDSLDRVFVMKTALQNANCERYDTVKVFGKQFYPPVFSVTADQITITNPQLGYTYEWKLNGQPVGNTSTLSITFLPSDSIDLKVSGPNGCTTSFKRSQLITAYSILEKEASGLVVFPNPASDKLSFLANGKTQSGEILDVLGRKKLNFAANQKSDLDIHGLSPGTYYLRIRQSDGRILNQRFVINR